MYSCECHLGRLVMLEEGTVCSDLLQVVSQYNPTTKQIYHASVNACLAPLVSVDGKHVITVEGIGNVKDPHPVQERIAKGNGSQCGFCTPGIVMVREPVCAAD
jgi:xanthine dehydrogenase/oxidase